MSKEMNKLLGKITKYNMICGLFMSLIIGMLFNLQMAVFFLLGITISFMGYISRVYVMEKWINKGTYKILITTYLRIFITVALIIPIMYDFKLVISYLLGFIFHFLVEGYCIKM